VSLNTRDSCSNRQENLNFKYYIALVLYANSIRINRQSSSEVSRTRQEHLSWAKQRSIEYARACELLKAINSIASGLQKHPETKEHPAPELALQLYLAGKLPSTEEMIKFIEEIG